MPKRGAAPAAEPETQTVEVTVDKEKSVAVNKTTGGTATVRHPQKVDLSGKLSDEDDIVSVTYWGPYGTGKTVDVLSMAKLPGSGNVLLVNAEAGAKPRSLRQHGIDPDRIVPWPPRGEQLSYEGLEALFYEIAGQLSKNPDSWLGGVWDSVTAIEGTLLEQVIQADADTKAEILRAANGNRAGNIVARDIFLAETDDYVRMQNQFRSLFRKFRYLPWHFAMTALVRQDENKKTRVLSYGPAVSPKLQNEVGGGPDIVIRTITEDTASGPVWYGRTYPIGNEAAKDRFGVLPRELVNPTFDRVVAYVKGELTEPDDPLQRLLPGGGPTPAKPSGKRTPRSAEPAKQEVTEPEKPATPTRTGKRPAAAKPAADEAQTARTAVQAETEAPKRPTKATSRTAAKPAPSELGSDEEPPF